MNADRVIALVRDVGCLTVSLGGIVYQQVTGQYNAALLALYGTLLTGAAAANLAALRRGATGTRSRSSSRSPRSRPTASSRSSPEAGDP